MAGTKKKMNPYIPHFVKEGVPQAGALIFNGPAPKKQGGHKYWQITNKGKDAAEVLIYGDIGEGYWSEGIGAKQFAKDLKALGDGISNLDIRINSAGGSVFEGLAIHNQLKAHKAQKTVYIDGLAASIASVIAMAGDLIVMPENAMLMIHDPSALAMGTADDMRKMADALDKIKLSLVTSYRRSGKTDDEIAQLMTDETWMTADDAEEMGFCDEVTGAVKMAAHFDLSAFKNTPLALMMSNVAARVAVPVAAQKAEECEKGSKDSECKDCPMDGECNKTKAQASAASQKPQEVVKMHKCTVCGHEHADGTACPVCAAKAAAVNAEQVRVAEIMALGQKHGFLDKALAMVKENKSIEDMKTFVIENMGTAQPTKIAVAAAHEGKPFRNFGEQLQVIAMAGKPGKTVDRRLYEVSNAASGMSESVPSDGGFLVQQDFSLALLQAAEEEAIVAKDCTAIEIGANSNGLKAPVIDESSRATGSRWGGVQVYWANEADTVTAKKPKLGRFEMELEKLMGVAYVTDELLQDSVALESIVNIAFRSEFAFVVDDAIINGDGAGKPLGILNAGAFISQTKEAGQPAATVLADNIEKMYARVPARSKRTAKWYMNDEVWPQLFQLHHVIGTAGIPIFLPPGGLSTSPFGTLLGRPIEPIEQCAAVGTVGDIIFADMKQYGLIKKNGLLADSSIHVRFLYDEMTFRFTYRINGQPLQKTALVPYKGSATKSAFVGIATRA